MMAGFHSLCMSINQSITPVIYQSSWRSQARFRGKFYLLYHYLKVMNAIYNVISSRKYKLVNVALLQTNFVLSIKHLFNVKHRSNKKTTF